MSEDSDTKVKIGLLKVKCNNEFLFICGLPFSVHRQLRQHVLRCYALKCVLYLFLTF